ncbi:MAG: 23S rRNA (guanosine(2251)-2'-O)-methyltransferase RlmB [Lachnospiraceae bacterium]|nr:23S rRNA (guanosine(2251)-2'-O)-methyltransferase RlmB [Lachnospiraceae bacterium]
MRDAESVLEGKNAVVEALRRGMAVERLFVREGKPDAAIDTVIREAKRREVRIEFVSKTRLDQLSETGKHQGVLAYTSEVGFVAVEDILEIAEEKQEAPFLILLDGVTDPHNLGAIIRTANACGAHGVITKKHGSVGLTGTVAKASAGAVFHTPVARVTNLSRTIEDLKKRGLWFVCADMDAAEPMHRLNLTGPIGLVIGDEGKGVSELVKKHCDLVAAIPMRGEMESLNASVAAGVLAYEIVRQRLEAENG